jgi:hypothetical protein
MSPSPAEQSKQDLPRLTQRSQDFDLLRLLT